MIVALILISSLLFASCYTNVVLVKRLFQHEDVQNDQGNAIIEKLETLQATLTSCENDVASVATLDVISDEPYVKRVVGAIANARRTMTTLKIEIQAMLEGEN